MRLSACLSQNVYAYQKALLDCCELIECNSLQLQHFNISVMTILLAFKEHFGQLTLNNLARRAGPPICATFSNQISIKLETPDGKCCCKFFRNGKVHVTGTKSIARAMTTVDDILKEANPSLGVFTLGCFKVEMLNTTLRLQTPILLTKLCEHAETKKGVQVSYDSSRYPGVKLRLHGFGVMLIFSSGSVIFTGCRSPSDVSVLFEALSDILSNHPEISNCPRKKTIARPKRLKTIYVCGYPRGIVDGILGYSE
jgi:TATA-box binding protein (TBP) (component of TFIID and TFIIIB)